MKIRVTRIQFLCHVLCVVPLIFLIYGALNNQLTANPIREIAIRTGRTAITILLISLLISPLKNIFGLSSFLLIRRPLGLYAAFYAALHFFNFIGLDYSFDWGEIIKTISQQIFLIIGLMSFLLIFLLAITSLPYLQRSLGKWWKRLHRLVYLLALLAILHFFLAVKANLLLPLITLFSFFILMTMRIPPFSNLKNGIPWIYALNEFFTKKLI
jgi:methionine sulfoxide reductase heme-binding subunit